MEQSELRGWVEHRSEMLFVCLKCLVLMIVGVAVAASWGQLSDNAEVALSIAVAVVGLFLWFGSHGAIMDIAAIRSDMDDDLASTTFGKQYAKAPFPIYLILNTLAMVGGTVMLVILLNA
jgi:hypothetical protein